MSPEEFAPHERFYHAFVRGVLAAVALTLLVLMILAWTFV